MTTSAHSNCEPFVRIAWFATGDDALADVEILAAHALMLGESTGRPVALYERFDMGEQQAELASTLRLIAREPAPHPSHFLLCECRTLIDVTSLEAVARLAEAERGAGALRVVERSVLVEVSWADGPAYRSESGYGEIIQVGSFRMDDPAGEWDLLRWYEEERLPATRGLPGIIRSRRCVSVYGPTKFGVIYEFDSVEAHERFVRIEETRAHDEEGTAGYAAPFTVHDPLVSPSLGRRIA